MISDPKVAMAVLQGISVSGIGLVKERSEFLNSEKQMMYGILVESQGFSKKHYTSDLAVMKQWPIQGEPVKYQACLVPGKDGTYKLGSETFTALTKA